MEPIPSELLRRLEADRLVPVLTIENPARAPRLGETLARAGYGLAEVALRTEGALAALQALAQAETGLLVGAGTVIRPDQAEAAAAAGAAFGVSPGLVENAAAAAAKAGLFFIPGAVTPSEALRAAAAGFPLVKFFPAAAAGGPAWLRALAAPLTESGLRWIPTGGIGQENLADYLATPGVIACGGSWIAPPNLVARGAWEEIEERARLALNRARRIKEGGP